MQETHSKGDSSLTKQIDFTKPLEIVGCPDGAIKEDHEVLQVIDHVYQNSYYKQAIVVKNGNKIFLVAANREGYLSSDSQFYGTFKFQNVKPKVTSETWVNLYKDGTVSTWFPNQIWANSEYPTMKPRHGYFVTKQFSDGTSTNEIIPISE